MDIAGKGDFPSGEDPAEELQFIPKARAHCEICPLIFFYYASVILSVPEEKATQNMVDDLEKGYVAVHNYYHGCNKDPYTVLFFENTLTELCCKYSVPFDNEKLVYLWERLHKWWQACLTCSSAPTPM